MGINIVKVVSVLHIKATPAFFWGGGGKESFGFSRQDFSM
jgi:hypothetical protein